MTASAKEVIAAALLDGSRNTTAAERGMPIDQRLATAILASLDAAGLVVVPREPTKEMVVAGDDEKEACIDSDWESDADGGRHDYTIIDSDIVSRVYRAMIAAQESKP